MLNDNNSNKIGVKIRKTQFLIICLIFLSFKHLLGTHFVIRYYVRHKVLYTSLEISNMSDISVTYSYTMDIIDLISKKIYLIAIYYKLQYNNLNCLKRMQSL